jgi:hypothetical protein
MAFEREFHMKQMYLAIALLVSLSAVAAEPAQPMATPTSQAPLPAQNPPASMAAPSTPVQAAPMPPTATNTIVTSPATATDDLSPPPPGHPSTQVGGVQSTNAGGETQTTIIDENGNLKMVEKPNETNRPVTNTTTTTTTTTTPSSPSTPGMTQVAPTAVAVPAQAQMPPKPNVPASASMPKPSGEPTMPSPQAPQLGTPASPVVAPGNSPVQPAG